MPTTTLIKAKTPQAPSGTSASAPALRALITAPATTIRFRPIRSAIRPSARAPMIAPTPDPSSMTVVWPNDSFQEGATAETMKPTMKKSKISQTSCRVTSPNVAQ